MNTNNTSCMRRYCRALGLPAVVITWGACAAEAQSPTAEEIGEWNEIDWGFNLHNAAVVPTGDVLLWRLPTWCDASSGDVLLDPASQETSPAEAPSPLGNNCVGFSFLPSGSMLIAGGAGCSPLTQATMFQFQADGQTSWSSAASMNEPRWYPTATTLGDGRVLLTFGHQQAGGSSDPQPTPEIYDPATDTWTLLENAEHPDGTNPSGAKTYPSMFLLPDGRVFLTDNQNGLVPQVLDVDIEGWTDVFDNDGQLPGCGQFRCRYVMYEPGKILRITDVSDILMIDFTQADPQQIEWLVIDEPPGVGTIMNHPRRRFNSVLLPNGYVLAVAGHTTAGMDFPVKEAEWINAQNLGNEPDGVWQELEAMERGRTNVHNVAILMPDGRVLSATGEPDSEDEFTAEIFSPPYLFSGNDFVDRPVISQAPGRVLYDTNFRIAIDSESQVGVSEIERVVLMGLGANTHTLDQNQRYVPLTIVDTDTENNLLEVTSPPDGNHAPPGYYMLFVISEKGVVNQWNVPSEAKFIQLVLDCPCDEDLNDDGTVDVSDLLLLLGEWGVCANPNDCPADLNSDGEIDVVDLLILLAAWGQCADCGGEFVPLTLDDCWERYHDDIVRYEECVEWVEEKDQYYPE